jgi:hypothetical protein
VSNGPLAHQPAIAEADDTTWIKAIAVTPNGRSCEYRSTLQRLSKSDVNRRSCFIMLAEV